MKKMVRMLRACRSLFWMQLRDGLQYRMAALAGASTSIFWALIEATVFRVFFLNAQGYQSALTLEQAVSWVWLGQFLFVMQPTMDGEIRKKIINGDVATELLRPMDLYAHWFARITGRRLSSLMTRGALCLGVGILMPAGWGMLPPASLWALGCFLISVMSAILLCSAYEMLMVSLRMSIAAGDAPVNALLLLGGVLSGSYLPLMLWPDFMQGFLLIQPFAGYLDIPARLYLGLMAPEGLPGALMLQLGWTLIFILAGRLAMGRRLQRMVVQGG